MNQPGKRYLIKPLLFEPGPLFNTPPALVGTGRGHSIAAASQHPLLHCLQPLPGAKGGIQANYGNRYPPLAPP
jgi:hypothetical protein